MLTASASEKTRMRRCASAIVIAAYEPVRLIPQASRALPSELFAKPSENYRVTDLDVDMLKRGD